MGTRPSSASAIEAPVAPRSWGSRWLSSKQGVPSVAIHTDAFARLAKSTARANGMPTTRQAYVPQPAGGSFAGTIARLYRGAGPGQQEAVHADIAGRPDGRARRQRPQGPDLRARHSALPGARYGRQSPAIVHGQLLDRFHADRPADRRARGGDAERHQPSARQDCWPPVADEFPRGLGVHRREGRGQRGDGRLQAGISAGRAGDDILRHDLAVVVHHVLCRPCRRQRPDPQGTGHEHRHRRHGAL